MEEGIDRKGNREARQMGADRDGWCGSRQQAAGSRQQAAHPAEHALKAEWDAMARARQAGHISLTPPAGSLIPAGPSSWLLKDRLAHLVLLLHLEQG
jgi:hypothetical protein